MSILKFSIPVVESDPTNEVLDLAVDAIASLADDRFGEGRWSLDEIVLDGEPRSVPGVDGIAYYGFAEVSER